MLMMDFHHVLIPFLLFRATVFTALHKQKVVTHSEVSECQSHDVTLLCQYENPKDNITQVQWTRQNGSNKYEIIVFNEIDKVFVHNTCLKDRVNFSKIFSWIQDASIIIENVDMSDQGNYSCDYTTFPSGSHTGQTTLKVFKCIPLVLSTAETVGIITSVVLITVITAAVCYLFLRNRRGTSSTSAHDTTQSSGDLQKDLTKRNSGEGRRSASPMDNIEYASVFFIDQSGSRSLQASVNPTAHTSEQESMYAQVKRL